MATPGMLVLPYTASSVGIARRRLIGDLADAGVCEGAACDAGLVLSELISNALRHATPLPGNSVKVSWHLHGDTVTVAVSDGGAETRPRVHQPTGSSLGGRGLGIVDRLSLQWGILDSREGPEGDQKAAGAAARVTEDDAGDEAGSGMPGPAGEPGSEMPPEKVDKITVWAELPVEYASVATLVIASSRDA